MSKPSSKQPTSELAALSIFKPIIRQPTRALLALKILSSLGLWYWFFMLSRWVDSNFVQQVVTPFPWLLSLLVIVAITFLSYLHTQVRKQAAGKISQHFFDLYFQELNQHRWALIRSKPATAWQDVSFRHIPAIEQYLLDYLPQRTLMAIIPFFVLTIVLPLSWLAALILFFTLPLIPLFMWLVGHGTVAAEKKHTSALNKLGAFFSDRVQGESTVRVLNNEARQLNVFKRVGKEQNQRLAEVVRMAFLSGSVLDFFATVSMAVVAVFMGFSLLGEVQFGFWGREPTLGVSLFILLISPAFFAELKKLGKLYHVKSEATASAAFWQHTLKFKAETNIPEISKSIESIEISDTQILGFDAVPLLSIKHLVINRGDQIRLTGNSGSGKTVLMDALAGLRDIESVKLNINHTAVENLQSIRDCVFYIGQEAVFFDGSIAENIGLGQFNDTDIAQAIERIGMGTWLKGLEKGLATQFHENAPLSGGQKQRLALARLVLFDLPIVLLDEPLAHLSISEQEVLLPMLVELTKEKTAVWISHKTIPASYFNRVIHVNDQTVVEVAHEQ